MWVIFWRTAFEQRGYVTEAEVGKSPTDLPLLNHAWEMFNRGSGAEVDFTGPSACVGDCFILCGDGHVPRVYYVQSVGFVQSDRKYNPHRRILSTGD